MVLQIIKSLIKLMGLIAVVYILLMALNKCVSDLILFDDLSLSVLTHHTSASNVCFIVATL